MIMVFVIPFFIPQWGCPHQCLFCNQSKITGHKKRQDLTDSLLRDIKNTINQWLSYKSGKVETQFAFYGGSFTCLPITLQKVMLAAVQPWLRNGQIDAIRLSTRPDCLAENTCKNLIDHGVRVVELGAQSFDDKVLAAARRGHTVKDCTDGVELLKSYSIRVGIQLMPGLPQESRYSFIQTVHKVIALRPEFVRLYPTLVVRDSGLERLFSDGGYRPLSLAKAVVLTSWARRRFVEAGIRVVRIGLHPSTRLERAIVAGPYHPSLGELVLSRDWLRRVKKLMTAHPHKNITITISDRDISAFNGYKKANCSRLVQLGFAERLQVMVDKNMARGMMRHVVC